MLGTFVKNAIDAGLWPTPKSETVRLSFTHVVNKVISSFDDACGYFHCHLDAGRCTNNVRELIVDSLENIKEAEKGCDLKEF